MERFDFNIFLKKSITENRNIIEYGIQELSKDKIVLKKLSVSKCEVVNIADENMEASENVYGIKININGELKGKLLLFLSKETLNKIIVNKINELYSESLINDYLVNFGKVFGNVFLSCISKYSKLVLYSSAPIVANDMLGSIVTIMLADYIDYENSYVLDFFFKNNRNEELPISLAYIPENTDMNIIKSKIYN